MSNADDIEVTTTKHTTRGQNSAPRGAGCDAGNAVMAREAFSTVDAYGTTLTRRVLSSGVADGYETHAIDFRNSFSGVKAVLTKDDGKVVFYRVEDSYGKPSSDERILSGNCWQCENDELQALLQLGLESPHLHVAVDLTCAGVSGCAGLVTAALVGMDPLAANVVLRPGDPVLARFHPQSTLLWGTKAEDIWCIIIATTPDGRVLVQMAQLSPKRPDGEPQAKKRRMPPTGLPERLLISREMIISHGTWNSHLRLCSGNPPREGGPGWGSLAPSGRGWADPEFDQALGEQIHSDIEELLLYDLD